MGRFAGSGWRAGLLCLLAALVFHDEGHATDIATITVEDGWTDYRRGGGGVLRVYLTLNNAGNADALVGMHSPLFAAPARFHRVLAQDGQRVVEPLATIEIPAESGRLEMSPLGYFAEFSGLSETLAPGRKFPVTLEFESAGAVEIQVEHRFHPPDLGRRIHKALQDGRLEDLESLRGDIR